MPLCAGVRQRRGLPRGHKGWTSRRRQPQGLPRGHQETIRCAPESDSKEAPRGQQRLDVTRTSPVKACPEGEVERKEIKQISDKSCVRKDCQRHEPFKRDGSREEASEHLVTTPERETTPVRRSTTDPQEQEKPKRNGTT